MNNLGVYGGAVSLSVIGIFVSFSAFAEDQRNEVFVGSYAIAVSYDDSRLGDDELTGGNFGYARNFTDNIGVRASFFSAEHVDFPSIDASGYDLSVVGGRLSDGFNIWGGLGYFSEEWEGSYGVPLEFSGAQLQFGVGYSWEPVSLKLVINGRDASDYESFVNEAYSTPYPVTAAAGSSSLNLGFRF